MVEQPPVLPQCWDFACPTGVFGVTSASSESMEDFGDYKIRGFKTSDVVDYNPQPVIAPSGRARSSSEACVQYGRMYSLLGSLSAQSWSDKATTRVPLCCMPMFTVSFALSQIGRIAFKGTRSRDA